MAVANGQQPHVPAWKRIGLKLKYAKDTVEPPSASTQPVHTDPHLERTEPLRTESSDQTENVRPSKKRKTSSTSRPAATQADSDPIATAPSIHRPPSADDSFADGQDTAVKVSVENSLPAAQRTSTGAPEDPAVPESHLHGARKRRKSVTFTGETKQEDGNSAKSFADPVAPVEFAAPAVETAGTPSSGGTPTKKEKKAAKAASAPGNATSKSKKKAATESRGTENREYVRYLEQFAQDKASWKFNKNHQTALLKNIFDTHAIDPSLTPALVDYISGLQGAGPRARLIETATAILQKFAEKDGSADEIEAMNTASARREAYYQAMWREVRKWEDAGMPRSEYDELQLEQMRDEAERGKRAEAILRALPLSESSSQALPHESSSQASPHASRIAKDTAAVPRTAPTASGQKRKKRVEASSDSSSSDSDSDSHSPAPAKAPLTVSAALRPNRTPAYQHDGLHTAYRPQNPSQLMGMAARPTRKVFDEELLDRAFPKAGGRKREGREKGKEMGEGKGEEKERRNGKERKKARGYAYTHGNVGDESGSEED